MYLIGNGPLVTRDEKNAFYENGAVVVEGAFIKEIGSYDELKQRYPEAEFINAQGKIIMPGLINTHQHIYSAFARGLSIPGKPARNFLEILEGTWWNIDRHMTLEQVYESAMATYMECIKNGVTTVIDHHASYGAVEGSLSAIEKAARNLGVRTCLCYEISDRDGLYKRDKAVEETMQFLKHTYQNPDDMVKGMVGLHASFTLSDETLQKVRRENTFGAGYHIHVAEGKYDASHCWKNHHTSIVKRLKQYGILGKDSIAGHCIHIDETDMEILRDAETMVVHNPESNMGNGVGCPDVIGMMDKGILVGLGTDGYTNDMLESLKVSNLLQKHRRGKPDRGFSEACTLLFDNNQKIAAKIFGVPTGVLKPGAKADLILMNYKPYTPMTADNVNAHIMFGMQGAMTDTVMINGTLRMQGRELLMINEQEVLKQAADSAAELWKCLCQPK